MALSELLSHYPTCLSNIFAAEGLKEFWRSFFFRKNLGIESAFSRPSHKTFSEEKKNFKNSSGTSWIDLVDIAKNFEWYFLWVSLWYIWILLQFCVTFCNSNVTKWNWGKWAINFPNYLYQYRYLYIRIRKATKWFRWFPSTFKSCSFGH